VGAARPRTVSSYSTSYALLFLIALIVILVAAILHSLARRH